jgi:D-glycero-alpha-D-manno-heptose-7-phosphate kinase
VSREIIARAPTRIDLGGGWTDVPPYCDREGGFVCNVAIARYAKVRLSAAKNVSRDQGTTIPLVQAALALSGVTDAAVTLESEFPVGAGLGGSSAVSAALLAALAEWRGERWDRAAIAEQGRRIEVEHLGIAGGRQDHYAATHGGALGLTFTSSVSVRRIPLSEQTRSRLASCSILVYTGESRSSGDTITAVLGAYERGETRVVTALRRMRELAKEMASRLERGDLDDVAELINEHWEHQRALHPSIPTARIDEIVARSRAAGALGAKAMGASGGGCVLVLARAETADRVRDVVRPLGDILDFEVDEDGASVERRVAA